MKPFDLEKALAGEPVRLRDGSKAYVKYVMPDDYKGVYPLRGLCRFSVSDTNYVDIVWTKEGKNYHSEFKSGLDIIGMWEESRPRVQLDLPCPLLNPTEGQEVWYFSSGNEILVREFDNSAALNRALLAGRLFSTESDAQEWLDAMRKARK